MLHDKTRLSVDKQVVSLNPEIDALWDEAIADATESEPERTRNKVRKPTTLSLSIDSLV